MKKHYFTLFLFFVGFYIFYILSVISIVFVSPSFGVKLLLFYIIIAWLIDNPINFLNTDYGLLQILMNGLFWSVMFTLLLFFLYIFIKKLYNIL